MQSSRSNPLDRCSPLLVRDAPRRYRISHEQAAADNTSPLTSMSTMETSCPRLFRVLVHDRTQCAKPRSRIACVILARTRSHRPLIDYHSPLYASHGIRRISELYDRSYPSCPSASRYHGSLGQVQNLCSPTHDEAILRALFWMRTEFARYGSHD